MRVATRHALLTAAALCLAATPALAQAASKAPTMPTLDDHTYAEIARLTDQGQALFDAGKLDEARKLFMQAWMLLPEPQSEWPATTWLAAAIGDIDFLESRYADARQTLQFAMLCPGGLGNPFLHLRLGQSHYELGELDRAADELMRAYMVAGEEIFAAEDPKYRAFLATRAKLD
ncbi:MAG: tetratricopeptide repeat protein [Pseudomonadota bacterium]